MQNSKNAQKAKNAQNAKNVQNSKNAKSVVTIRDVARVAGVSIATVSAVVNGARRVSKHLTERVRCAVDELGYAPNRSARALRMRRTNMIGCIVPTIVNPFFAQILKTVEDTAFEHDLALFVCSSEESDSRADRYRQLLLECQVDGVILSLRPEVTRPGFIDGFLDAGIPVVGLAGIRIQSSIDCVISDDVCGASDAIEHLISIGHTRIAYIGLADDDTNELRMSGYVQSLNAAGIDVDERLLIMGNSISEADGYKSGVRLVQQAGDSTAVLVYNDVIALGVLSALRDNGIRVPSEMSVVGYDDTVSRFTSPRLSTVAILKEKMARTATRMLVERIDGTNREPETVRIRPELVVRESVQ